MSEGTVYNTRGKLYRVLNNDVNLFSVGDLVIAVENDDIPWCVLKEDYKPEFKNIDDYPDTVLADILQTNPFGVAEGKMHPAEIELIEEEEQK